jgi:hypothetical protein
MPHIISGGYTATKGEGKAAMLEFTLQRGLEFTVYRVGGRPPDKLKLELQPTLKRELQLPTVTFRAVVASIP